LNVLIASIINLQPESEDNIINFVIDNADNDHENSVCDSENEVESRMIMHGEVTI